MAKNQPDRGDSGNPVPGNKSAKERDANFLADEFDVPVPEAAELVASEPNEADEIEEQAFDHQKHKDPLEDVPTPESPLRPGDRKPLGHMQKTVRHKKE